MTKRKDAKPISDEMIEAHLQGELSIRDIADKVKMSVGYVHKYLSAGIAEYLKSYRSYAIARAEYLALQNWTELLEAKGSRDLIRKDITLKTLEGLGILKNEQKHTGEVQIIYKSNLLPKGYKPK